MEDIRRLLVDAHFRRAAGEQAELDAVGISDPAGVSPSPVAWADSLHHVDVHEGPSDVGQLTFVVQVEATTAAAALAAGESLVRAYAQRAITKPLAEARRQFDLRQQVADDAAVTVREALQAMENFQRDHAAELEEQTPPTPLANAADEDKSTDDDAASPQVSSEPDHDNSTTSHTVSAEMDEVRQQLAQSVVQRNELLEKFTAAHPRVRDLEHRIAELESTVAEVEAAAPPVALPAELSDAVEPDQSSMPGHLAPGAPLAPDPIVRTALLVRLSQLQAEGEVASIHADQAAAAAKTAAERLAQLEACGVEIVDRRTTSQGPAPRSFANACLPATSWAALAGLAAGFGVRYRVTYFRTPAEACKALGLPLLGAFKPRGIRPQAIVGQALGSVSGLTRAGAEFALAIVLGWIVYLAWQDAGFVAAWHTDPWDAFAWAVGQLRNIAV